MTPRCLAVHNVELHTVQITTQRASPQSRNQETREESASSYCDMQYTLHSSIDHFQY